MDFRLLPLEGRETIRVDVFKLEPGAFAPGFLLFTERALLPMHSWGARRLTRLDGERS
jgi:hypothetical protein